MKEQLSGVTKLYLLDFCGISVYHEHSDAPLERGISWFFPPELLTLPTKHGSNINA
jgi:hypothetical protein